MADVGKVYPTDIQLIQKQIEIQGDLISRERLDREAEIERLRIELAAIKHFLDERFPEFMDSFEEAKSA